MAGVEFDGNGVSFASPTEKKNTEAETTFQNAAERSLARSVQKSVAEQETREQATRAEHPEAYRLSGMSDADIDENYRHGKETMSSDDLLAYFEEGRKEHIRSTDLSETPDPLDGEEEIRLSAVRGGGNVTVREKLRSLPERIKALPGETKTYLREAAPTWFDPRSADTSHETKRIPLSAFASLLAVAVSLMLIVASSVMVIQAERRMNEISKSVDKMNDEITALRSDLDVSCDLLELRELATREFGMVSEEYLRMTYLHNGSPDSIEIRDGDAEVGIPALFKALGEEP